MSLAAEIYHALTMRGLAPPVPFCAAPDAWREAISGACVVTERAHETSKAELRRKLDQARRSSDELQQELIEAEARLAELEKKP